MPWRRAIYGVHLGPQPSELVDLVGLGGQHVSDQIKYDHALRSAGFVAKLPFQPHSSDRRSG